MGRLLPGARASALPVAILLLVLVMMVPIPKQLLDVFFITNIAISLAVLMVALNAQKPLDFSSFPTVLLFATLFRLGLNVASTRVVLVHGHEGEAAAGHVIEAFGTFLIGGDYVVGLFVFSILIIINMIVVTKGAGRVSEVSARFTLDALPGKQMAIDADLNAGLITPDDAKKRRVEVATEADFYGSMDGSSKFVKGDAVAGLLILAANIVGGLILGPVSHGLTIAKAAQSYTMLAIGDALVASKYPYGYGAASLPIQITLPETGRLFGETPKRGDVVDRLAGLLRVAGDQHAIDLVEQRGRGAHVIGVAQRQRPRLMDHVEAAFDDLDRVAGQRQRCRGRGGEAVDLGRDCRGVFGDRRHHRAGLEHVATRAVDSQDDVGRRDCRQ